MNLSCYRLLYRLPGVLSKTIYARTSTNLHLKKFKPNRKIYCRCCSGKTSNILNSIEDELFDPSTPYQEADFEQIADGDPEVLKSLKLYQLEIDLFAQEGGNVPSKITASEWMEILMLTSKSKRFKYINNLWVKEMKKLDKKRRQEFHSQAKSLKLSRKDKALVLSTNSPPVYGLSDTSLFHRFYPIDMRKLFNFRLLQAMMFGPHLIVDCGYEEFMNPTELTVLARDMLWMWSYNREYFYPFDIVFCNLNTKSLLYPKLCGLMPAIQEDAAFPFNMTDEHYTYLYPKEKLVYLTPDCNDTLEKFNADDVYILGGIFQKGETVPLSLARAKKDGLRMAKFPLDTYLKWNYGSKRLSLAMCLPIIADLRDKQDWNFALRNISKLNISARSLLDEGSTTETNAKNAAHIAENCRRKEIYDMLLPRKLKKN